MPYRTDEENVMMLTQLAYDWGGSAFHKFLAEKFPYINMTNLYIEFVESEFKDEEFTKWNTHGQIKDAKRQLLQSRINASVS